MDWFTNHSNGNVLFVNGVSNLSSLDKELLEKYGIGNISDWGWLGADNMFGEEVIWGIYGEPSGHFNVLKTSFYNFRDLSANFMNLQGYNKVISSKTIVEKEITRTFPEANKGIGKASIFKEKFPISEKTEYTYVDKGLSELNSNYHYRTIEPPIVIGAAMTISVGEHRTTYTYTVPKKRSWLGNLWHRITNF